MTTCPELVKPRASIATVDLRRYWALHGEGRRLISGWFDRAWQARDCKPEEAFEPFIFAWFAFNGWAACVTEVDQDRGYLDALMCDKFLCQEFAILLCDSDTPFFASATQFAGLWPFFEVKELRRRRIMRDDGGDRAAVVNSYITAGARRFDPSCWRRHNDTGEVVPLDWPHTLAAIYRVRCNLFHGEKAAHSEMDQRVVSGAFRTLVHYSYSVGLLGCR